ncbi:serine hydrolase [Dinghuibacter silviterrae]|uniref:CubicO group peptidase (Beta-lactamase class C family) n=1 Tax=Dinghuibacter silviterrae TaxID=1539049 RepID=A0A4R8DGI1_9BACT|nr:serine hydrolase [Dinghuibacter silviterrae]TDW96070.1 CubicO group peptidase (beta-lactamase class C family) [Dinghuibacter silviterrae]
MKVLHTLLLLVIILSAHAQNDTLENGLLRDIPRWMAENHVPCVGVGLISDGKIQWIKTFGSLQQGSPAPGNTLFNIASQTKPVTAMLTLRLVQLGLWNLDEPLSRYWIDPDIAGDPNLDKLTTRLVLSHQSGFPNWRTDNGSKKLHFVAAPGTRFGYSGEGFEYLRRALEHKFQRPLDALLDSFLFKPAGMNNTQYWSDRLDTARMARWHDGQGHRYPLSMQTSVSAADDLITTVEDYCRFGIYTMNGGGLSDTLFADMTTPQVKVKTDYYRGLGWGLVKGLPGGEYALEHGGSDIGVRTMAIFLPVSKRGIVLMTNGDNGMFVTDQIIRCALSHGAQVLETMNKGARDHERIHLPDSVIDAYTGSYAQDNGKVMKVEREGDAIKVSGDGVPTAVLYPESTNSFFLEGYDVQIQFPDPTHLVVFENGKQVMTIRRASLKADLEAIASDSTEGRFTASAGYLKAADYLVRELKKAGLQPYLQPVPFTWDDYTGTTVRIDGVVYPHTPENFVVVQGGAAGRVRLPDSTQSADWETTVIRQYRFGYMHYVPDSLPSTDSCILLSPKLAALPHANISITFHHRIEQRTGYNVIAHTPGEPVIIVTAHLDHIGRIGNHIYNGANDDASGCVAELGAARTLSRSGVAVYFVWTTGEELGLKGSRWFVDHLPVPKENIRLHINLEQVGSQHRSFQEARFIPADSLGEELRNTDGYSFTQQHIPSVLLTSGGFPEHHTIRDTIGLIDVDHLQRVTDALSDLIISLDKSTPPRSH